MGEAGSAIRVLHVDDDRQYAETAAAFLERESAEFDIDIATNAQKGARLLETEPVDCIVSDYEMPDQNGIDFLESVREDYPDLPFILYTGRGSEAVAGDAISAGVTDYLQKSSDTSHYALLANRIVNAVEQYRSQRALEESKDRLSLFIDQSPLGFVEFDRDFEIIRVNDTLTDIFGYTEDELVGETWEVFVSDESYDHVEAVTSALSDVSGGYHSINENVRKDGEHIEVEWHNRLVTDDSGDVVTIFSHCQEVTERIEHEQNLAQLRDFFDEAEQLGDLGAWEYDESGMSTWTAGTRRIHEVDDDFDPTVDDGLSFYHPDDRETVADAVEAALEHGEPYDLEVRLVTASGNCRWVRTRGKRVEDSERRTVRGFIQDITEQKERERRLRVQNERLDSFASVVSHDLQGPLTVAQGHLELAQQEVTNDHLDSINDAHERMQTLIDDILTLARDGRAATTTEAVALQTAATACWETVDTGNATLETTTDSVVFADPRRLQRLLENLFRNCVAHGAAPSLSQLQGERSERESMTGLGQSDSAVENDGGVTVTVGDLDGASGFYIADDGPGIPEDERDTVFEAGYSTASEGTGFGLAIVADIAAVHGWEVSVTDSESGGARFEITGVDKET
ncbi:hybrid sensor histidine kinase/response regulator [Haloarcula japonica]|uniref:histidine kinase n=1 Tax=Haloarcula japonica (strain ATCC 49778 / DSM 6131 / JCM 7785 / NBRC 101032 / NCIMB 13157 / TR-1) TaxID=1227453 RepID=M0LHM0_HALJT|nr:PAS domain S-box protein [Haloarcula japonica]EMA33122.1 HTR-like protein [Haloarcula japonica DSM 6131]